MKPQEKKSINIGVDLHRMIKMESAASGKDMAELMREAWLNRSTAEVPVQPTDSGPSEAPAEPALSDEERVRVDALLAVLRSGKNDIISLLEQVLASSARMVKYDAGFTPADGGVGKSEGKGRAGAGIAAADRAGGGNAAAGARGNRK